MSQDTPDSPLPSPSDAPVHPVTATVPRVTPSAEPRRPVSWLSVLALLLAAVSLVAVGLMWQKLGFTQQELARRSQDSATQVVEARTLANKAEAQTKEMQARLAVAEVKLSEVTLQRSQLEELMLALSRSRDDTLVQDLDSALRLAMQQAQLTGSAMPLISALQAADQRISRAAQPRLNPVQRAIARDVDRIKGAALADVPTLVQRVDELARQVEEWPVLNDVPVASVVKGGARVNKAVGAAAGAAHPAKEPPAGHAAPATGPASLPDAPATASVSGWTRVAQGWNGFWRRVWEDTTRSGRELVRVSRIDQPEAALLAPEQAFFLRENLKLRLLNARLGLLSRQQGSVESDLKATSAALQRYFDATDPKVKAALKAIEALRSELSATELPRPDETLSALAAAAGGR